MAALHGLKVTSVQSDLGPEGSSSTATYTFYLTAYLADGTAVSTWATFAASEFPTDETTFEDRMWGTAFGGAFAALGHALPEVPEWSPWPIV